MPCYNFPNLPAVFSSPDGEDRESVLLPRHLFSSRTRAQVLSLLRELAVPEIWWLNPWMSCLPTTAGKDTSVEGTEHRACGLGDVREPLAALTPGMGYH